MDWIGIAPTLEAPALKEASPLRTITPIDPDGLRGLVRLRDLVEEIDRLGARWNWRGRDDGDVDAA